MLGLLGFILWSFLVAVVGMCLGMVLFSKALEDSNPRLHSEILEEIRKWKGE